LDIDEDFTLVLDQVLLEKLKDSSFFSLYDKYGRFTSVAAMAYVVEHRAEINYPKDKLESKLFMLYVELLADKYDPNDLSAYNNVANQLRKLNLEKGEEMIDLIPITAINFNAIKTPTSEVK
jgi:hypothetical protein